MLQDNFEVVKRESKSNGYNAIHLDASLKHDRIILPEYEHLAGLKFEVQIVTVLQHSWAEIEHDRRYKRDDVLPPHIDQKFNSISETLVKCDNALEQITKEVDDYEREQTRKVDNNELDILIDSPSLRRYLFKTFGDIPDFTPQYCSVTDKIVIDELHAMGIETIAGFEKVIPINLRRSI